MLNKKQILHLIETQDFITNYIDLEEQLTSNGIDLTLKAVHRYTNKGAIDFDNSKRVISDTKPLPMRLGNAEGWSLKKGVYLAFFNEITKMPLNLVAIARPRSSLVRNGATIETGVWDAGYHGMGQSMLFVLNEHGIDLYKDARVVQLIFFPVEETEAYVGIFQNEGRKCQ